MHSEVHRPRRAQPTSLLGRAWYTCREPWRRSARRIPFRIATEQRYALLHDPHPMACSRLPCPGVGGAAELGGGVLFCMCTAPRRRAQATQASHTPRAHFCGALARVHTAARRRAPRRHGAAAQDSLRARARANREQFALRCHPFPSTSAPARGCSLVKPHTPRTICLLGRHGAPPRRSKVRRGEAAKMNLLPARSQCQRPRARARRRRQRRDSPANRPTQQVGARRRGPALRAARKATPERRGG